MIRYFLFLLFAFLSTSTVSFAQMEDPVDWTFQKKQLDDGTWELIFTADIDPGWSVYSQFLDEGGPVPTSVNYNTEEGYELIGDTKESGLKNESFDELFGMDVIKFSERMVLTQKIKVNPGTGELSGYVEYMTCDDNRCLPPMPADFSFTFDTDGGLDSIEGSAGQAGDQGGLNIAEPEGGMDFGAMMSAGPESDILNPITWNARVTNHDDGTSATLIFEGVIQEGWYIYSGKMVKDQGPVPIEIHIDELPTGYQLGDMEEMADQVSEDFDNIFGIDVIKVEGAFSLKQYIAFQEDAEPLRGFIEYMSCTSEECIFPPVLEFEYNPVTGQIMIDDGSGDVEILASEEEMASGLLAYYKLNPEKLESAEAENCIAAEDNHTLIEGSGLWRIFFLGFIGGLIALLTPCVFPMIPLTVSFFTKNDEKSKSGIGKAVLYGTFILVIYLLFSLPFYFLDSINPDILNNIATNVGLNLFFFLIFLFFAFSFFGYYELTLPSSWTNKVSQAEGVGGFVGIFFMALTLVLVSFSCTGPILGSLLAGSLSTNGGAVQLTVGMGGFGLSLALPFAVFAAFPSFMNKMPRSGSWLNSVKVVMGFIELALAFKFLSNADLVKNWGILKIEPFLIIWAVIAIGLALYLFGLIRFPHDSKGMKISIPRKVLGIGSMVLAVYLLSGFRYNEETQTFTSLKLLSGLAPPVGYSWIHPNDCPNNINCFKDLESGMAYAAEKDLPVIIDFSGYACVNCRKMEEHVWPNPGIKEMLHTEFVLISLYVDDRTLLSEEEQITLPKHNGGERKLRTVGDKWHFFQTEYFRNNSQPLYALLDSQGKLLNKPVGYTPSVDDFRTFLRCGLDIFKERNGFGSGELIGGK